MDASYKTALQGASFISFTAVSIALPGGTVRLVSGGTVSIGGNVYAVEDSTFGQLRMVEGIEDGADGQASRATITLLPPTSSAIATISAPAAQGSAIVIYQGAVDPATGLVIGTPETLFTGELDYPHVDITEGGWQLVLECGTEEGRLLEPNHERKLSDAFHQMIWPGELGLSYVTRTVRKIYWRASDPATAGVKGRIPRLIDIVSRQ